MQMLYNSDSFVVVRFDVPAADGVATVSGIISFRLKIF